MQVTLHKETNGILNTKMNMQAKTKMKHPGMKPQGRNILVITALTSGLMMAGLLAEQAHAGQSTENQNVYVDSVHHWGAWEMDIEPAAGGIQSQTTQPLSARNSRVSLRTNSISALGPNAPTDMIIAGGPGSPAGGPSTPITPPVTTIPTITPIAPNVPVPASAPNDGF